jgi:hypothetical protein
MRLGWKSFKRRPHVSWWAPYWSHLPRARREWRELRQLLGPKFVLRVTITSTIVGTLIVVFVDQHVRNRLPS